VIVTGRINALSMAENIVTPQYEYTEPVNRTGKVRPLSGGISIGVSKNAFKGKMAGTLSVVVLGPNGYSTYLAVRTL
jgi:hypothetical protein